MIDRHRGTACTVVLAAATSFPQFSAAHSIYRIIPLAKSVIEKQLETHFITCMTEPARDPLVADVIFVQMKDGKQSPGIGSRSQTVMVEIYC